VTVVGRLADLGLLRRVKAVMTSAADLDVRQMNGPVWATGIDFLDHRSLVLGDPIVVGVGQELAIVLSSDGDFGLFQGPPGDSYAGGEAFFDARPAGSVCATSQTRVSTFRSRPSWTRPPRCRGRRDGSPWGSRRWPSRGPGCDAGRAEYSPALEIEETGRPKLAV
jgi:hypothetical protein